MSDPLITAAWVGPTGQLMISPLVGNPIGLWEGLRLAFVRVRPTTQDAAAGIDYPETTNADVAAIIDAWARVIGRDYRADADGAGFRARWEAYVGRIDGAARHGEPAARFVDNRGLWLASLELARGLSAMYRGPSTIAQFGESVVHGAERTAAVATGALLGGGAAALAGGAVKGAVGAVGHTLGNAAGAVWDLAKVLLIGSAVVVGAVLVVPRLLPAAPRRAGGDR